MMRSVCGLLLLLRRRRRRGGGGLGAAARAHTTTVTPRAAHRCGFGNYSRSSISRHTISTLSALAALGNYSRSSSSSSSSSSSISRHTISTLSALSALSARRSRWLRRSPPLAATRFLASAAHDPTPPEQQQPVVVRQRHDVHASRLHAFAEGPSWSLSVYFGRADGQEDAAEVDIARLARAARLPPPHAPSVPAGAGTADGGVRRILTMLALLAEVNTAGVEPLESLLGSAPLPLRDDGAPAADADMMRGLAAAAVSFRNFFVVPLVK